MKKLTIAFSLIFLSNFAHAKNCDIIIKNHKFTSGNLKLSNSSKCEFTIKAEKKHKITICNQDNSAAEFESHDLKIEKIIKAKKSAKIRIRKLKTGKIYRFEEEFHKAHCQFRAI